MIESCQHGNAIIVHESGHGCPLCLSARYNRSLEGRIHDLEDGIVRYTNGGGSIADLSDLVCAPNPTDGDPI